MKKQHFSFLLTCLFASTLYFNHSNTMELQKNDFQKYNIPSFKIIEQWTKDLKMSNLEAAYAFSDVANILFLYSRCINLLQNASLIDNMRPLIHNVLPGDKHFPINFTLRKANKNLQNYLDDPRFLIMDSSMPRYIQKLIISNKKPITIARVVESDPEIIARVIHCHNTHGTEQFDVRAAAHDPLDSQNIKEIKDTMLYIHYNRILYETDPVAILSSWTNTKDNFAKLHFLEDVYKNKSIVYINDNPDLAQQSYTEFTTKETAFIFKFLEHLPLLSTVIDQTTVLVHYIDQYYKTWVWTEQHFSKKNSNRIKNVLEQIKTKDLISLCTLYDECRTLLRQKNNLLYVGVDPRVNGERCDRILPSKIFTFLGKQHPSMLLERVSFVQKMSSHPIKDKINQKNKIQNTQRNKTSKNKIKNNQVINNTVHQHEIEQHTHVTSIQLNDALFEQSHEQPSTSSIILYYNLNRLMRCFDLQDGYHNTGLEADRILYEYGKTRPFDGNVEDIVSYLPVKIVEESGRSFFAVIEYTKDKKMKIYHRGCKKIKNPIDESTYHGLLGPLYSNGHYEVEFPECDHATTINKNHNAATNTVSCKELLMQLAATQNSGVTIKNDVVNIATPVLSLFGGKVERMTQFCIYFNDTENQRKIIFLLPNANKKIMSE